MEQCLKEKENRCERDKLPSHYNKCTKYFSTQNICTVSPDTIMILKLQTKEIHIKENMFHTHKKIQDYIQSKMGAVIHHDSLNHNIQSQKKNSTKLKTFQVILLSKSRPADDNPQLKL